MGPAPMIRMVEISVRLGIRSREVAESAQKKGALAARPLSSCVREPLARVGVLDQIPRPCNPQKGAINRDLQRFLRGEERGSVRLRFRYAQLRRTRFVFRSCVAAPRVPR